MKEISRRDFVRAGAAGVVGVTAMGVLGGCAPKTSASDDTTGTSPSGTKYTQYPNPNKIGIVQKASKEEKVDFVVVGAGIGGLTCAMVAAEQKPDAKIVLLEKMGGTGGNSNFAEVNPPGHGMDAKTAIANARKAQVASVFLKDPNLMAAADMDSGKNSAWFVTKHHAKMGKDDGGMGAAYYAAGNGAENMAMLTAEIKAGGAYSNVDLRVNTRATALLMDDEYTCTGVQVLNQDGTYTNIKASAVHFATGGMGTNLDLLGYYTGQDIQKEFIFGQGQDGDGHLMVEQTAHGMAKTVHPSGMWNGIKGVDFHSPLAWAATMQAVNLLVNQYGERIVNEDRETYFGPGHQIPEGKMVEFEGKIFSIMGSNLINHFKTVGFDRPWLVAAKVGQTADLAPELEKYKANENLFKADTLEALAAVMGVPADAFLATVQTYEADCKAGTGDTDFGKQAKYMVSLGDGPYYGIRVSTGMMFTICGIRIDRNCQVCDPNYKPIKGLFAGGICANGWNGEIYQLGTAQNIALFAGSRVALYVVKNYLGGKPSEKWYGDKEYDGPPFGNIIP
jgi:fumarate reductase flavoprotein subunit